MLEFGISIKYAGFKHASKWKKEMWKNKMSSSRRTEDYGVRQPARDSTKNYPEKASPL